MRPHVGISFLDGHTQVSMVKTPWWNDAAAAEIVRLGIVSWHCNSVKVLLFSVNSACAVVAVGDVIEAYYYGIIFHYFTVCTIVSFCCCCKIYTHCVEHYELHLGAFMIIPIKHPDIRAVTGTVIIHPM